MTPLKLTALIALVGACLIAAGCGSDDEGEPIPADSAALLQEQLDSVQRRIDNGTVGACEDILGGPRGPNVDAVNEAIAGLPDDVSEDVRAGLQDGFDHLFTLVDERCTELRDKSESRQQTETEAAPEPAAPETDTETQTETTPPETDTETQTETTPPETDTGEQPTPTEEQPPAEEPQDNQGGGGGVIAPEGEQG